MMLETLTIVFPIPLHRIELIRFDVTEVPSVDNSRRRPSYDTGPLVHIELDDGTVHIPVEYYREHLSEIIAE